MPKDIDVTRPVRMGGKDLIDKTPCSTRNKCEKHYAIGPSVCIDCPDYEREPVPGDTLKAMGKY